MKRILVVLLCALILILSAPSRFATAAPNQIINESRSYFGPGTHFGPTADVSSKYVGALAWKGTLTVGGATEYDAEIYNALTGQHLWTLSQPVPADQDNYRFSSIAIDGDLAVIGATYATVGGVFNAGAAYVYDLTNGQLKHKLLPTTSLSNSLFGSSVDILGNRVVVGSWGNAYVFDATTGSQLAKLAPSTPSDQFGISVALTPSAIVVGSNSDTSRGSFTGAAFAFNPQTYAQMSKFVPAASGAGDNFGLRIAADGNYAIGSGQSGAYVFDVRTGTQVSPVSLPGPYTYLGQGNTALVGNPALQTASAFDWTTTCPERSRSISRIRWIYLDRFKCCRRRCAGRSLSIQFGAGTG
jgi:hypothetical protein